MIAQFSGLATGIDSAALIDAIIESRETTNILRRNEIEFLNSESDALEEFNTKLLALNELIDGFRTVNGGGVLRKATSSNSSVATASATSSAVNGSHALTVNAVADSATASFNDSYASLTALLAPNAVGTQTIGVDIGTPITSVDVDITNTTTVQQYVDAFNANTNAAGKVFASAVNVGTTAAPSYRVMFTTINQGVSEGSIAFDIPTGPVGFGGNSDLQNRTVSQATDASFSLAGIGGNILRSSNTVGDVITGVTFQLLSNGTTTATVSNDSDGTSDLVQEIVQAYNDLVEFANENDLVEVVEDEDESQPVFASLAKTRVDDDFLSSFRSELLSASSASGTIILAMSQMGISTARDGTLLFDADEFKDALASDVVGASEVLQDFADQISGVSGLVSQYTRFNGFIDLAQQANDAEISNLNASIEQLERSTAKERESLTARFARLEGISAGLQSQQNALTSVLAGL